MTAPLTTLDFTDADHRDCEWEDPDGTRYRFMDRASGTGFFRWDQAVSHGEWVFHSLMVFDGPFARVPLTDELGEYADDHGDYCCADGECDCY